MRKTAIVTIADDNRDRGKIYHLEEMPASKAEDWAARALLAVSRSGVNLPDNIAGAGMAGVAMLGLRALAGITFGDARELMAEMMQCIKVQPNPDNPTLLRPLVESDIEEIQTRAKLRLAVLELHTGFSWADVRSRFVSTTGEATA